MHVYIVDMMDADGAGRLAEERGKLAAWRNPKRDKQPARLRALRAPFDFFPLITRTLKNAEPAGTTTTETLPM